MAVKFEKLVGVVPKAILELLPAAFEKFDIDGPLRASHFLGQTSHESGDFTIKTESMNYTSPQRIVAIWPSRFNLDGTGGKKNANDFVRNEEKLANEVYGGRMGNNEPGDGFRFRGGGFMQVTGKESYREYAKYIDKTVGETADLLRSDNFYALDGALWLFSISKKLNTVADLGVDEETIKKVTKKINGGHIGLEDRKTKTNKYYGLLK